MAAMLCDVVHCRRWVHAPVIHAASHFDHEKRVAWGSIAISMPACGFPACMVMELRLAALQAAELRYKWESANLLLRITLRWTSMK